MSPAPRVEIDFFTEIIAELRRWADYLEQYLNTIGDQEIGPPWPKQDLIQLYQTWLEVGNALRDLTRTQPTGDATEVRPEVAAIRDGIRQIADIHARQV